VPMGHGPWAFLFQSLTVRVTAFVDGFNLYHALHDLNRPYLKWLNLRALCQHFAPQPQFQLDTIYYFSAYATWRVRPYRRHREYVTALRAVGVTPILGRFKIKNRECRRCGTSWQDHEEKETDVNIALRLLLGAVKNEYDRALLISGDSDLAPAVRAVKKECPSKNIRIIAPVNRAYSMDLYRAAGGKTNCRRMKLFHVERSLLDGQVEDSSGSVVAVRPSEYDPPWR
jgi:uncharacterized LabA/DUF88 family protein